MIKVISFFRPGVICAFRDRNKGYKYNIAGLVPFFISADVVGVMMLWNGDSTWWLKRSYCTHTTLTSSWFKVCLFCFACLLGWPFTWEKILAFIQWPWPCLPRNVSSMWLAFTWKSNQLITQKVDYLALWAVSDFGQGMLPRGSFRKWPLDATPVSIVMG